MMESKQRYWLYGILVFVIVGVILISGCIKQSGEKFNQTKPETKQTPESQKYCGDGVCDGPETSENCPEDCGGETINQTGWQQHPESESDIIIPNETGEVFQFLKSEAVAEGAYGFSIPVYDGENIVVSYNDNTNYEIMMVKYTKDLQRIGEPVALDNSKTYYGDHKHVFLDGYHYIVVGSHIGEKDAGTFVYSISKVDRNLNMVKSIQKDYNLGASNDMFMTTDGNYIYVGFLYGGEPGKNKKEGGHIVFVYDKNLNYIKTIDLTEPKHKNCAGATFADGKFYIFSSDGIVSTCPPPDTRLIVIPCDENLVPEVSEPITVINTENPDEFPTGVVYDKNRDRFYVAYNAGNRTNCKILSDGGLMKFYSVNLVAIDKNFEILDKITVSSPGSRGHLLLVDDTLYVGYDTMTGTEGSGGAFLKMYKIMG